MAHEARHDTLRNHFDLPVHTLGKHSNEMLYEQRNIFFAFAQRRYGDGKYVKPVV